MLLASTTLAGLEVCGIWLNYIGTGVLIVYVVKMPIDALGHTVHPFPIACIIFFFQLSRV